MTATLRTGREDRRDGLASDSEAVLKAFAQADDLTHTPECGASTATVAEAAERQGRAWAVQRAVKAARLPKGRILPLQLGRMTARIGKLLYADASTPGKFS